MSWCAIYSTSLEHMTFSNMGPRLILMNKNSYFVYFLFRSLHSAIAHIYLWIYVCAPLSLMIRKGRTGQVPREGVNPPECAPNTLPNG